LRLLKLEKSPHTEEDLINHLATRGIPFKDEEIVGLLALMLDTNINDGHAAELAVDILQPYIGKGRVKETTWRDYLIDGKPKTIIEIIPGRMSRQYGIPHIPLSMTRIPDSSIDLPKNDDEIHQIVDELEDPDEARPVWGEPPN